MKVGGRERMDDGVALEELFASLPVSADWTIGFLTALRSGPDPIAQSAWIPELVAEGAFDETPKARARVDLLARLLGAVAETLRTTPEIICPEPDKPVQEAIEFCLGYLRGARMHETWRRDEVATMKLFPFEAIASAGVDSIEATAKHREGLGSSVADLHAYWLSKRQIVNATTKVGRNDPCPCGSGKKHKKCCLAKPA